MPKPKSVTRLVSTAHARRIALNCDAARRKGKAEAPKQNQANLLVGLYHTSAIKINSTVNNKLIGYTSMIVWKVRLQGKTRYTYAHHGQAAALNSCSSTAVAATGSANSGSLFRIDPFSMSILFS